MPKQVTSSATIEWTGTTARGSGVVTGASGALDRIEVDIPNRIGEASGKSTPEELLAAAIVTCFTTAVGSALARAKTPPERMTATATVTMDMSGEKPQIPVIELQVEGDVPEATAASFAEAVEHAERTCLISRVLTQGTTIRATGSLAGSDGA